MKPHNDPAVCFRQQICPSVGSLIGSMGIVGKERIALINMSASCVEGGIQQHSVARKKVEVLTQINREKWPKSEVMAISSDSDPS